LDDWILTV